MAKILKTPGVYIEERSAFPNSVVPVATALPAFIGYTERADHQEKSLHLKPTRISSLGEYLQLFGGAPLTKFTLSVSGDPELPYALSALEGNFTLYRQMKMFFANGGADCYVVSVGGYTNEDGTANAIELETLRTGIAPLLKETEPTMLVVPEAVHAPVDPANIDEDVKFIGVLQQDMLRHCGLDMKNRFAILDVWTNPNPSASDGSQMGVDIDRFREAIGTNHLSWGATYFPWLHTSAVALSEIGPQNIGNIGTAADVKAFTGDAFNDNGEIVDKEKFRADYADGTPTSLIGILDQSLNLGVLDGAADAKFATQVKTEMLTPLATLDLNDAAAVHTVNQSLLAVSPVYKAILHDLQQQLNFLPPSAAMAGIYAMVDNQAGVWQSPANIGVSSVIKPAFNISNEQQEDMNVPINGKAINAIRTFPGRGVLVWGARTLDGNSLDWRYVSVRRTVIFIEQSVKLAAEAFVFEPNVANTWASVKAMLSNFLTNLWQSGCLAGASSEDAFSVDVGLGTTMTSVDVLDGIMRTNIKVAVTRPAEFIVITFEQQMQQG